uniref:Uncharacterized protein n=1 Tax=Marseillevirus LCMAC103 TaxID=2506604 RepID=A0A481YUE1_9VIRU|nr:MAG: uncharacterized protein LCMAC103_01240 [Marseillevirus LCMAC103]
MDGNSRQAFTAVTQLVKDLWAEFGGARRKRKSTAARRAPDPLKLYKHCLSLVQPRKSDAKNVVKFLGGFVDFFAAHGAQVVADELDDIPKGVRVAYSARAYIPIQKYIYKSRNNPASRRIIRSHLLTIAALIELDDDKADALLQQVAKAEEAEMAPITAAIGNIMEKAQIAAASVACDGPSQSNPMEMIGALLSSGALGEIMTEAQNVMTADLNPEHLLRAIMSQMSKLGTAAADVDVDGADAEAEESAGSDAEAEESAGSDAETEEPDESGADPDAPASRQDAEVDTEVDTEVEPLEAYAATSSSSTATACVDGVCTLDADGGLAHER